MEFKEGLACAIIGAIIVGLLFLMGSCEGIPVDVENPEPMEQYGFPAGF